MRLSTLFNSLALIRGWREYKRLAVCKQCGKITTGWVWRACEILLQISGIQCGYCVCRRYTLLKWTTFHLFKNYEMHIKSNDSARVTFTLCEAVLYVCWLRIYFYPGFYFIYYFDKTYLSFFLHFLPCSLTLSFGAIAVPPSLFLNVSLAFFSIPSTR